MSLALALDSGPGTLAVLAGAGASASAGLLTAWEVRQELIVRVARAHGEADPEDPEAWWSARGEGGAGYDDLLAALSPTPAGRRNLLREFFEADDEERERGDKQPGPVHHALARLVRSGAVRVVITTNFDPLIETAIRDAGVEPVVVDSVAGIQGMEPLQHQQALVVHLHGHYLSPETLNTPEELSSYPEPVHAFLNEVFDRYGLLILGWSATWDVALRERLQAARSPRYGTWWVDRGPLREHSLALASARRAHTVVDDAGAFVSRAADAVEALGTKRMRDPVSAAGAVAYAKRALSGRTVAVPLHDAIRRELDRVRATDVRDPADTGGQFDEATKRDQILARSTVLVGLVATSAYWGDEKTDDWWVTRISRLTLPGPDQGVVSLIDLRLAPATLATHAAGVAAAAAGRHELVARLASGQQLDWRDESGSPATILTPERIWATGDADLLLRQELRTVLRDELALGAEGFAEAWERWALICSVERHRAGDPPWAPLLTIVGHNPIHIPALRLLRHEMSRNEAGVGLLAHGNLGGTPDAAAELLANFEKQLDSRALEDTHARLSRVGVRNTRRRYLGRPDVHPDDH